jgi:hypothetical protein
VLTWQSVTLQEVKKKGFVMKKRIAVLLTAAVLSTAALPVYAESTLITAEASEESSSDVIYTYLTGELGLNSAAACGILGNMYQESHLNADISGGSYYGLCQWGGGRKSALYSYCSANGYDPSTLEGQLHFLGSELTGSYSDTYAYLQSVPDTADGAYAAADYFCRNFEQPGNYGTETPLRGGFATDFFSQYGAYEAASTAETTEETAQSDADESAYAAVYDYANYSSRYPDLQAAFGDDRAAYFQHFLTYGMKEGRQAKADFSVSVYKAAYSDLRNAFGSDLPAYYEHYITYGQYENRTAA